MTQVTQTAFCNANSYKLLDASDTLAALWVALHVPHSISGSSLVSMPLTVVS